MLLSVTFILQDLRTLSGEMETGRMGEISLFRDDRYVTDSVATEACKGRIGAARLHFGIFAENLKNEPLQAGCRAEPTLNPVAYRRNALQMFCSSS